MHTLRFIKRARALGFSMEDTRELVGLWKSKSRSSGAVKRVAGKHIGVLRSKLAAVQAMVDTLEYLMHHCHGGLGCRNFVRHSGSG